MANARNRSTARKTSAKGRKQSGGDGKQMTSPKDLFEHELNDIYAGETLLLDALEELESDSTEPALAEAFGKHRGETEGHLERLDEIAEMLQIEIEPERCPGIEGLIEEKKLFGEEKPTAELVNLFNVGAGQKSERYEITHYEGLIDLASKLGYSGAVPKLRENLKEEEAALKTLKSIGDRIEVPEMTDGDAEDEE